MNETRDGTHPGSTLPVWLVCLALFLFLLVLMPATQLWDRDEPLYARTAIEMLRTGDFILPTFDGEVFAHKPPLIYWLMALSVSMFGVNEFAVRLVSAFGMAGAGYMTFLIGQRLFNRNAGLWAMIFLMTGMLSAYLGSAAMLDAVLLFFVVAAIWAYVELIYRPQSAAVLIPAFGIALALSMLTKGPVGPAVVLTTVALSELLSPKAERISLRLWALLTVASAAAVAVFLAWAIPADIRSGGEMVRSGFGVHIFGRALQPMEGHGGSGASGYLATLLIYVPVIIFGIFPWILHLPGASRALVRGEIGGRRERAVLWGWAAPTFVMFTLAATKLPHYVYPMFPAVALALAATVDAHQRGALASATSWWLRQGAWIYAVLVCGSVISIAALPFVLPGVIGFATALPLAIAAAIAAGFVVRAQFSGRVDRASSLLAVSWPVFFALAIWLLVPAIEPGIKASKAIASIARSHLSPETVVLTSGYDEPSLVFYLDRPVENPLRSLPATADEAAKMLSSSPSILLVATAEQFALAQATSDATPFVEIGRISARNLNAGGRLQEIVIAGHGLAPAN